NRPEALVLPAVFDHEGDFGYPVRRRLVARDADQRRSRRGEVLEDEREAPVVVDVGEKMCPIRRQATHHGEEALVARVLAQPVVELGQSRLVVRANRPNTYTLPGRQRQHPVESRQVQLHTAALMPPSKLMAVPVMNAARADTR